MPQYPGNFAPGTDRNDAPQEFDGPVTANGAVTMTNALTQSGNTTFSGAVTMTGATSLTGTVSASGPATFTGTTAFTGPVTVNGVAVTAGNPSAADLGLLAWSFDTAAGGGATILGTGGSVYGTAIYVRSTVNVTNLWYDITTAGTTLTTNNCWALLYNSGGTLIGQSADQHTIWATAGIGGSAGGATALSTVAAASLTGLTPGLYWGAVVATGNTLPSFAAASGPLKLFNVNTGTLTTRCGILATSVTTTPGNITPASITQTSAIPIWMGLS